MQTLAELEAVVLSTDVVFDVKGHALAYIFETYPPSNYDAYCQARFGFTHERARQFINAARVVEILQSDPTTADLLPASEAIARPLTTVPQDRVVDVWTYIVGTAVGEITQAYVQLCCEQIKANPNAPLRVVTRHDLPDAEFPSDNPFDIPVLLASMQATSVILPFVTWGAKRSAGAGTYHFYTDDNRFTRLIGDPTPVVNSGVACVVEPNFSIYGQMPRVLALGRIYHKRWIARFWQSEGLSIFVDLNVAQEFRQDNLLGVPSGWKAYATRGYTERLDDTLAEFDLACQHAETDEVLFLVYGGGQQVKELAKARGWLWYPEHMDKAKHRGIADEQAQ